MMKRVLCLGFIVFLFTGLLPAQNHDSRYVDGELYFKVKSTFTDSLTVNSPVMLPLVLLYHMDSCYRPFMGLNNDSLDRTYRIRFTDTAKTERCMDTLQTFPIVDYVEKVPLYTTNFVPNDVNVNQWALQKISAEQAWDVSHGSSNVVVAIVDNGVRINHQDLSGNLWTNTGETANNGLDDDFNGYTDDVHGYDVADNDADPSPPTGISQSDEWNHGTHCAGIASAATNNGTGIASVGFNTRIMAVKCTKSSSGNGGQLTNVDDGITYAMRNGANVISMSFGSNGSSVTEQLLISSCINKGIVMVAAAGNDDTTAAFYPAAYNGVICVGATDQNDKKASFSNYGSRVDVMAPGVGIYSTLASGSGSDYGFFSGTSMACPMVAGLAGLVLAVHPSFTPAQVANQIKSTADNISAENPGLNGMLGGGRINASRAIGGSTSTGITAVNALTGVKLFPNPFSSQVAITGLIPNGNCVIECYDMEGRRVATPVNAQGTGAVVETSGLATGAYIIKLTSGGESACFRLMKF